MASMHLPHLLADASFCAVIGHPIAHSKSPFIHRQFAEQVGLALQYERIDVHPDELPSALETLRAAGCRGLNVTLPHKAAVAALAVHPSARVAATGAANTLWWDDGLHADNTDGRGLVRDLTRWGCELAGRKVLMLGAGGAAAGVIPDLLAAGIAGLWIWNRTAARAAALCARFSPEKAQILAPVDDSGMPQAMDLVINATSAGVVGEVAVLPAGALAPQTACYDMFYADGATPFLSHCQALGARQCRDGLGMLVEQAAVSFERWHGYRPDTAPVLAALSARQ